MKHIGHMYDNVMNTYSNNYNAIMKELTGILEDKYPLDKNFSTKYPLVSSLSEKVGKIALKTNSRSNSRSRRTKSKSGSSSKMSKEVRTFYSCLISVSKLRTNKTIDLYKKCIKVVKEAFNNKVGGAGNSTEAEEEPMCGICWDNLNNGEELFACHPNAHKHIFHKDNHISKYI